MPFKSEAQREKLRGILSPAQFAEWERDTPQHLPRRLGPPAKKDPYASARRPPGPRIPKVPPSGMGGMGVHPVTPKIPGVARNRRRQHG